LLRALREECGSRRSKGSRRLIGLCRGAGIDFAVEEPMHPEVRLRLYTLMFFMLMAAFVALNSYAQG